jgi:hypothetical protein
MFQQGAFSNFVAFKQANTFARGSAWAADQPEGAEAMIVGEIRPLHH